MQLRAFGAAAVLLSFVMPALAEEPIDTREWETIYQNDFSDMHFAGVTRNKFCVEQAFQKAAEIRNKGGSVGSLIHLEEAVQLVAQTYDDKQLVIACSATGTLAIFFKAPASLSAVFNAMGTMKDAPQVQPADAAGSTDQGKVVPAATATQPSATAPAQ